MDRFDWLLIVGVALIAIGFAMVNVALGLIVAGAGCMALSLIGARNKAAAALTRKDKG